MNSQGPVPRCIAEGVPALFQPLVVRLRAAGVVVIERPGAGVLRVGEAVVAVSDGRMACQRAQQHGLRNLVLLDLALDYASAQRLGISWADRLGLGYLVQVLDNLQAAYGEERFRPSLLLRRCLALGRGACMTDTFARRLVPEQPRLPLSSQP